MVRPTCVPCLLLLLFVMCRHCWGALVKERTGYHPAVDGSIHNNYTEEKINEKYFANENLHHDETNQLKLNLLLERKVWEPTSNSSRADFPCPSASAIAPCVCTVDANDIDLDCTFVESEEQLAAVFQQLPVKELHGFYMANNSAIKVLGNILKGVTFVRVDLSPGPFALQVVSEYFLLDSKFTLSYLQIQNSKLISGGFPFAILVFMETLDLLTIRGSNLTWIPKITSPTIRELRFISGSTDVIEPGTFDDATNLSVLELDGNSLTELRAGTVPMRARPMTFQGRSNDIQVVHPGAFFFPDDNNANSSDLINIDLIANQLQVLQAGTFPIGAGAVTLYLYSNQIASIEPGTFFLAGAAGAASRERLHIDLAPNLLQSLLAGTFPLRNAQVTLLLYSNQIASIEPGTFILPNRTDSFSLMLDLKYNHLTTFDEAVFGDLMPFITELQLHDNPLSCDCNIAWLVIKPAYMAKIDSGATCDDGINLHDLDPQNYIDFC